jgi:GMP synthase (glutamine-hydrolysing)
MRPLAILVTGDPVPPAREARGTFADMIRAAVGDAWSGPWLEVDCRSGEPLPDPSAVAMLVPTGSSASVTERADWILETEGYLRRAVAAGTPIFGICFGHQLLGQALGGLVETNPRGRQIGTVEASWSERAPLLDDGTRPFLVNTTHRDVVTKLPPGATVLASTPKDPNAVIRFAPNVVGVQFHPEFDRVTVSAYIESRREILEGEGFDVEALLGGTNDAKCAANGFARFVREHARR